MALRRPRAGDVTFEPLGDRALRIRFGDRIDVDLNQRVHALAAHLRAQRPAWLCDIVPAYASLGLYLEPEAIDAPDPLEFALNWARAQLDALSATQAPAPGPRIEIRVRYGNEDGPDLTAVAAACGLSPDEVIARHLAPEYRVAMLGFAPGFPYLLGLDPALALPRRAQPRRSVSAGSVAIGGAQTGIYPRSGAGGWHLIGRTEAILFDPKRDPPALLQPGDRVRFAAA